MSSHLTQHDLKLKEITNKHRTLDPKIVQKLSSICYKVLPKHVLSLLQRDQLILIFNKSKKLEVSGSDYPDKLKKMVNDGIKNGNYEEQSKEHAAKI